MRRLLLTIVALILGTSVVRAQAPAAPAAKPVAPAVAAPAAKPAVAPAASAAAPQAAGAQSAAPAQTPPGSTVPPAAPPENYTYAPDGRRDPFTNLLNGGGDTSIATGKRTDGAASLAVAEIQVRGILQSRGTLVAMVQGPDNKTYIVHQGDRLADGSIKSITTQGLVVIQEVNDPLSLVKQREVSKLLRSLEGVK